MVTYLGLVVESCCEEGGTLLTNITGMCGECSQCLGHTGFATAHCMCAFPVYTARLQVALQGNCLKWALCCQYFPGLSQIQVLGYFTKAQTQFSLRFLPFPGLSSSGDQVHS